MDDYERLAQDLVLAYDTQDVAALQRLNGHYRRTFTFDDLAAEIWRRVFTPSANGRPGYRRTTSN